MTLPGFLFGLIIVGGCVFGIGLWYLSFKREEREHAFRLRLPSLRCPACHGPFGERSVDDWTPAFLDSKDWFYRDRSQWPEGHREASCDEIAEVRCPYCRAVTLVHYDGTPLETEIASSPSEPGSRR